RRKRVRCRARIAVFKAYVVTSTHPAAIETCPPIRAGIIETRVLTRIGEMEGGIRSSAANHAVSAELISNIQARRICNLTRVGIDHDRRSGLRRTRDGRARQ